MTPGTRLNRLQARRIHHQQPVPRRHQVDLAFPGWVREGHALPGHGPGKGQGGLVFVHPLRAGAVLAHHVEVVPAHLLEPAEIAHGDDLPLLHGRPFAEARDDPGHVMEGPAAHGLFQRHGLQGRGLRLPRPHPPGKGPLPDRPGRCPHPGPDRPPGTGGR